MIGNLRKYRLFGVLAIAAFALTQLLTQTLGAQASTVGSPVRRSVAGIAYDSLRRAPLANAFVVAVGLGASTTSDELGRFKFDSIPFGPRVFELQHDLLDSIGLSGLRTAVRIDANTDTVHFAVPSFGSLWARACGTSTAPHDSGFVFGSVRTAGAQSGVANATISVSWTDVNFTQKSGATELLRSGSIHADAQGEYAVCGIPNDITLRLAAASGARSTDAVNVVTSRFGVRRLDVSLASDSTGAQVGIVVGTVQDENGKAIRGATVSTNDTSATTDALGRFAIRRVPVGTRQITARSIGLQPVNAIVDVVPSDTASVIIRMSRVTVLDSVHIKESTLRQRFVNDIDARRHQGLGRFVDSTLMVKRQSIMAALAESPRLKITRQGITFGNCAPLLLIDKAETNLTELQFVDPTNIGMIEIYDRRPVPAEFWGRRGAPCGVIVIWTKRFFP